MMKLVQKMTNELIGLVKKTLIESTLQTSLIESREKESVVVPSHFLLSNEEFMDLVPANGHFH